MSEFSKTCDIHQGYNFNKDKQTAMGYITSMKVGDVDLNADQTIKDPLSPGDDLKVVGILTAASWETGATDALTLSSQISVYNKQTVLSLIYKELIKIDVVFQFSVYEYDPVAGKYFKCLHCNDADLNGLIEKRGDDLNMSVAEERSTEVNSPQNYAFNIGINPKTEAQTITIATSFTKNIVKAWGVKLDAA